MMIKLKPEHERNIRAGIDRGQPHQVQADRHDQVPMENGLCPVHSESRGTTAA
jgi:hypothetical protein